MNGHSQEISTNDSVLNNTSISYATKKRKKMKFTTPKLKGKKNAVNDTTGDLL